MSENIDISILGIDRRPSKRQTAPGLCKDLINLRPSGNVESPYWVAEPSVDLLRNSVGVQFNPADKSLITEAGWHIRSAVGSFGQSGSTALKRLVCILSNGRIRVYDPNMSGIWAVVSERSFTDPGVYDGQVVQFNNSVVINVTKDNQQYGMFVLVDDLIVSFEPPSLPSVVVTPVYEGANIHDFIDDLGENRKGIIQGSMYVQFAYELFDGTLIKHSSPQIVTLPKSNFNTHQRWYTLSAKMYDFTEQSSSIQFWRENIASVAILVGNHKPAKENDPIKGFEEEDLKNILFYKATFIPLVTDSSVSSEPVKEATFELNEQLWSTLELANIDPISHKRTANVLGNYNSRLMLGGSGVDFPLPRITTEGLDIGESPGFTAKTRITIGQLSHFDEDHQPIFDPDEWEVLISGHTGTIVLTFQEGFDEAWAASNKVYGMVTFWAPAFTMIFEVDGWRVTVNQEDFQNEDYLPIENFLFIGETENPNIQDVLVGVDIKTSNGVFQRISNLHPAEITDGIIALKDGIFTYPDRRATKLKIWKKTEPGHSNTGYILHSITNLTQSATQNFSFCPTSQIESQVELDQAPYNPSVNNKLEVVNNRVSVSETNNPFLFLPERTYYVGGSYNIITAFASNTLAMSQGQFGQFPLYVFSENNIYALEQTADPSIAFSRITPVSMHHGVNSRRQLVNIDRMVAFTYGNGIYTLGGNDINEISHPVANYPDSPFIDYSQVQLSSRKREGSGELIAALPDKWYVFNTRYNRWYQLSRTQNRFFNISGEMYSVASNGDIYNESEILQGNVSFTIDLDPIHFLKPELLKRIFAVYFRGSTQEHNIQLWHEGDPTPKSTANMAMRIKHRSAFSFRIRITGQMDPNNDYIQAISADLESRYPQRTKIGL